MVRLLLGLMIVVLVALSGPSSTASANPGSVAPATNQGMEFGQAIDDAGRIRFTDEVAQRIAGAGAAWVRINFRLGRFYNWTETTTFGYSALSLYDEVVATAQRNGLQVIGLLSNESWPGYLTDWQANNAEAAGGSGDNPYLQGFSQHAAVVLAQHFTGRVDRWEIWNEPNAEITYLYPSNFAWLLARVYTEVKAAGVTTAQFISGGVSTVQAAGESLTGASTGADYLRATYARGKALAGWETILATYGSYPLDAVGQHLYVDGYRRTTRATIREALQRVRDAYVEGERGSGAKLTVVTEVGWASSNVSEAAQADNLQTAFAEIMATPYVQTASWFFLRDEPVASLSFGLLRPDGSEKPAWLAYRVVTIPAAPPLQPSYLDASGFPTGVRLNWQENLAPDLAGYHVSRATTPGGPFQQLTATPIITPTYLDKAAPPDVPLYYQVTAVDTGGNASEASETKSAARIDQASLSPFERTWERTDKPVADGRTASTWMWGSRTFTPVLTERYDDSSGGYRQVQYFDKSRMEITHPDAEDDGLWYVTNGLLVKELITGRVQVGDDTFIEREPAAVNVAGDPGTGPTYAILNPLRWAAAKAAGEIITERLGADGKVTTETGLATRGVKARYYVSHTRHTVAAPFWQFMNSSGLVYENGQYITDQLFENPFYATGYPITEAYWTLVTVGGTPEDVLVQCFERRCLTYTPDNPAGWQVEAGNVGQHYFLWRYGASPM